MKLPYNHFLPLYLHHNTQHLAPVEKETVFFSPNVICWGMIHGKTNLNFLQDLLCWKRKCLSFFDSQNKKSMDGTINFQAFQE